MPLKNKKKSASGGARTPEGKKQMLVIMDKNVIFDVKVAALEDGVKMSHAVEEAVKEWLAKRDRTRK